MYPCCPDVLASISSLPLVRGKTPKQSFPLIQRYNVYLYKYIFCKGSWHHRQTSLSMAGTKRDIKGTVYEIFHILQWMSLGILIIQVSFKMARCVDCTTYSSECVSEQAFGIIVWLPHYQKPTETHSLEQVLQVVHLTKRSILHQTYISVFVDSPESTMKIIFLNGPFNH